MKKSTKNQIKAEFFEFLRENDCASKFCVNFYKKEGESFRDTVSKQNISQYLNEMEPGVWITGAFKWLKSIENFNYWKDISIKWDEHLQAINYNIQKSKDETNSR